jgi:hypothetical protein
LMTVVVNNCIFSALLHCVCRLGGMVFWGIIRPYLRWFICNAVTSSCEDLTN